MVVSKTVGVGAGMSGTDSRCTCGVIPAGYEGTKERSESGPLLAPKLEAWIRTMTAIYSSLSEMCKQGMGESVII